MEIAIPIVNAFIDGENGGNPAGVVLDADRFSDEQKQAIAARIGLSETAFVSRSESAAFKLDFYTPSRRIAHCGHATIATFSYLHQVGRVMDGQTSKETVDGNREIWLEDGMAFMEQLAPVYTSLTPQQIEEALASLQLVADDLIAGCEPIVVNTGNSFLLVPLKNRSAVRAAQPQADRISALSETLDLIGFYAFALESEINGRQAGTRMFAPRYGIDEEAATGMAAGPLACILHDRFGVRSDKPILIEQGHWMRQPSPSVIQVRLDTAAGQIRRLMAGGYARQLETRNVAI